jgi:predicted dehydrogenase
VRLALVGLGSACAKGHLPAITALAGERAAEVCGLADHDPERRALLSMQLPDVPTYANAEELLRLNAPDVLVIATDPFLHPELICIGLARGIHVVCEKPLALTPHGHAAITRACAERGNRALIPVHQYRYSPEWQRVRRRARLLAALRIPFTLTFDVQRPGFDVDAVSPWRAARASGGMLADAGVHFLALGWAVGHGLTPDTVHKWERESGEERVQIDASLGCGTLRLRLWRGAPTRSTRIELRGGGAAIAWTDRTTQASLGGIGLRSRPVAALSERAHVDALYRPLYRDVARRVADASWGAQRTEEALAVSGTLVGLLDHDEERENDEAQLCP